MLNNGTPQCSVLVPLLFNLYIKDLPVTSAIKFVYADDLAQTDLSKDFEGLKSILTDYLDILHKYY